MNHLPRQNLTSALYRRESFRDCIYILPLTRRFLTKGAIEAGLELIIYVVPVNGRIRKTSIKIIRLIDHFEFAIPHASHNSQQPDVAVLRAQIHGPTSTLHHAQKRVAICIAAILIFWI